MYKINRKNLASGTMGPGLLRRSTVRNVTTKTSLKRNLRDYNTLTSKHSLQKINSLKRLTKQNIQQMQVLRIDKLKQRKEQILNSKKPQEQRQVYRNSVLPRIPQYKSKKVQDQKKVDPLQPNLSQLNKTSPIENNSNEEKDQALKAIEKLPTRQITSTQDMAKVFNSIMNGTQMQPLSQKKSEQKKEDDQTKDLKSLQQSQVDKLFLKITERVKSQVFDQQHIDYHALISIGFNLYREFPKNNMIKSIMLRAMDRYNRSQFYKVPDDKLKDVIQIILDSI